MDMPTALEKLDESRARLLTTIAGLPRQEMIQVPVEGVWTVKDLIAHITSWEQVCLAPLRVLAAEGAFVPENIPDHLVWNDQCYAQWQNWTLETILHNFHQVRQELVGLAHSLPETAIESEVPFPWGETGNIAQMLSGLAWHENEHTQTIQEWKDLIAHQE